MHRFAHTKNEADVLAPEAIGELQEGPGKFKAFETPRMESAPHLGMRRQVERTSGEANPQIPVRLTAILVGHLALLFVAANCSRWVLWPGLRTA